MPPAKNWVFVTGAPRSGTTFVGMLLSAPWSVDYIHEPFNPHCGMPGIDQRFLYLPNGAATSEHYVPLIERLFQYDFRLRTGIGRNDSFRRRWIKRLVGSRGPFYLRLAKLNPFSRAAVVKDPIGCFLTEFLVERFPIRPLILLRHPIGFVASLQRLNWTSNVDFLPQQQALVERYFSEEPDFVERQWQGPIASAAAYWRILNKVLYCQIGEHPDWTVQKIEDLCEAPVSTFRQLFETFDLPWSTRIERRVRRRTESSNSVAATPGRVQDFRRHSAQIFAACRASLTSVERRQVFDITHDVALQHYSEESFLL